MKAICNILKKDEMSLEKVVALGGILCKINFDLLLIDVECKV